MKIPRSFYNHFLYAWYQHPFLFILFWPFSLVYQFIIFLRRFLYQCHILKTHKISCPVIVVGNLVVGGSGKTPVVIWLANTLQQAGFKPGIITRGYGGDDRAQNIHVTAESLPMVVGDEPVMIAKQTQCLVVKNKNRVQAAETLAQSCDVIISDDGLQHYALGRDLEIALLGQQQFIKNLFCLPAGPWRESKSRLKTVDFILGNELQVRLDHIYALDSHEKKLDIESLHGQTIHAVCGIAMPWRFFTMLSRYGITVIEHAYPDHYAFNAQDLAFDDGLPVFITEKDAIKCQAFKLSNVWVVKIKLEIAPQFKQRLLEKLTLIKGAS